MCQLCDQNDVTSWVMHVFIIVIYSNPIHVRTVINLLLVECSLKQGFHLFFLTIWRTHKTWKQVSVLD